MEHHSSPPQTSWEASAPSGDDHDSHDSHETTLLPTASSETHVPPPPICESAATTTTTNSDSLTASVDHMWEARRAREDAERIAEQKLIDAVCAASLLEYNETNRAMEAYENDLVSHAAHRDAELQKLKLRREAAEQKKRDAMQKVIDAKTRSAQMSAKVKDAANDFQAKAAVRVGKEMEREQLQKQHEQEQSLRKLHQRTEDAGKRREDAERKAQEAREKAEAMRQRAMQAAQVVRQHSRKQIEHELTVEEDQRQRDAERTMSALEQDKLLARDRKDAAAQKALEALKRAKALQLKAEQARSAIRTRSEEGAAASPQQAA